MTLKRIQVRISGLQGFTAVELVVVLLLMGTMAALAIPRAIKQTPQQEVDRAARQLVRDLEQARLRAMASKRVVRVAFYPAQGYYAAVALTTADGESTSEMSAEAADAYLLARGAGDGARSVDLPGRVTFGSGEATLDPLGEAAAGDAVSLLQDQVEFGPRGLVRPVDGVRKGGAIFLAHRDDPHAVAAVTVQGSGAFRAWRFRNGGWQ